MNILQDKKTINLITEMVIKEIEELGFNIAKERNVIPVSVSARHLHLKQEHVDMLFGHGYTLKKFKNISQPGQYAAEEKLTIVGPRGKIENVRVLGPLRRETQVEISPSDARILGVEPVIRQSGFHEGTPGVKIIGPKATINIEKGCIVAERHIHMTPQDALDFGVMDGQKVNVKINGVRAGLMDEVYIRVRKDFALDMHIDVDDANAFSIKNGEALQLIK